MTATERELLWGNLPQIANTTQRRLKTKQAYCFINLYNDWLGVWSQMLNVYSKDVALRSLVAADLFNLGKELHWMHRLLHWGNYPLVHRNLRYVWELMFLAYFADTVEAAVPEISDQPGECVDDKVAWLHKHEWKINWRSVIRPLVYKVIEKRERQHYSHIWGSLNRSVHASVELRYRLIDESALAIRDAFDLRWAKDTCQIASDVFDVIWLVVLRRFPDCIPFLGGKNCFINTPRTKSLIAK